MSEPVKVYRKNLGACRRPVAAAVDGDQEVHGDERELETRVEEDQVAGEEDADHGRLDGHEPPVILLLAAGDRGKRAVHAQRHEQRGEQDEQHGHRIDAHVERDAPLRQPRDADVEVAIQSRAAPLEGDRRQQIPHERHQRADEGDPLRLPRRGDHHRDRGGQRNQQQSGQPVHQPIPPGSSATAVSAVRVRKPSNPDFISHTKRITSPAAPAMVRA